MAKQCSESESSLSREILSYLVDNPDAQDTLEGIVEWWLLDREIKRRESMVRKALEDLIEKRYVVAREDWSGGAMYRINPAKIEEVKKLLAEDQPEE